jgi:hypothetical protein
MPYHRGDNSMMKIPKGMHMMPDGKLMKDSDHKGPMPSVMMRKRMMMPKMMDADKRK